MMIKLMRESFRFAVPGDHGEPSRVPLADEGVVVALPSRTARWRTTRYVAFNFPA
jgi:hypothetical protein